MVKSRQTRKRKRKPTPPQTDNHSGEGISATHKKVGNVPNPLREAQIRFLETLPKKVRDNFFSESHVEPDVRADIWSRQAELGENLVNDHSWATPDEKAMKILKHFGPIVEIGCGANGYWSRMMRNYGIDIIAFDSSPDSGGKIDKRKDRTSVAGVKNNNFVSKGGPEVLSLNQFKSGESLYSTRKMDQKFIVTMS
mmetsp:Transcript_7946/g.11340  ORF Transcript_7946/g.11340 Transcript_7946/m.11340 type:complete len:196 (-) Transcript_7946:532-1119(-)